MLFEVRRTACVEKIKQTLNNELKFHIVNIYYTYVRCDESLSLYSRINGVLTALTGTSLRRSGIIKTMHTGSRTYCIMPTPRADI